MTENSELKESFVEFIKSILALCPAYNRVSRMLLDMRGRSTTEIDMKYPELLQERMTPLVCDLFDITFGATISVYGFGAGVAYFIDYVERTLSDERKRKILEQQLGVSFPNPCKEYVKLCVDALKEKDPTAAKLLVMISEMGVIHFDRLLEEARKRGLVIADKAQLADHLSKLVDLNLVLINVSFNGEWVSPSDKYGRYAKEFVT
jgi:hypothetical protein